MGRVLGFEFEKLVVAVLLSRPELKPELLARLEESFGPADWLSPELPFGHTHYYDAEMGQPITRFFVSCQQLVDPAGLAGAKRTTNDLEEKFRRPGLRAGIPPTSLSGFAAGLRAGIPPTSLSGFAAGLRPVNLDPGLLSLARFVLASTKPSAHRVPLASGIYAEIELLFERGSFRPVEWTYPDYRTREYLDILGHIRGLLKAQRAGTS
jgi:hypothetical protein